MFGAKYLGSHLAEIISVSTSTGDASVTQFEVPSHYLYDLNVGCRRRLGRYQTSVQLNTSNLANDEKFHGATWQVGRPHRLSATVNW